MLIFRAWATGGFTLKPAIQSGVTSQRIPFLTAVNRP